MNGVEEVEEDLEAEPPVQGVEGVPSFDDLTAEYNKHKAKVDNKNAEQVEKAFT